MIDFFILVLMSIAEQRWEKRVILTRDVPPKKYLSRWFLLGGPETEGMEAGLPKGWGLYLHCFHQSDDATALHSHPWRWALSLVLKNGYIEDRREGLGVPIGGSVGALDRPVVRREVRAGRLNFLRGTTFHRVDLDRGEAWTLFLVGPGVGDWGFLDLATREYTDWRTFLGVTNGVTKGGGNPKANFCTRPHHCWTQGPCNGYPRPFGRTRE